MNTLFSNAVQSIQLGVEDYNSNDLARTLSAVRNFYAGVLLLAKEVLARVVPNASPEEILGERYKPIPDGKGGVEYVQESEKTIDFNTIGARFRDFNLPLDQSALRDLNRIRRDIEHLFTKQSKEKLREAIAKAFPLVANLFRLAGEEPHRILGQTWQIMLDVRELYQQEVKACRATFDSVDWQSAALADASLSCQTCNSNLVAQKNPSNTDPQSIDSECRVCGAEIDAEGAVVRALRAYFASDNYNAFADGSEPSLNHCPECGLEAYIFAEDESRCAWCGFELEERCARCSAPLTPNDAWHDDPGLCSYCGHTMSKDD